MANAPQTIRPVTAQRAVNQNPQKGCSKALLWTGGIIVALIAGCAMLGHQVAGDVNKQVAADRKATAKAFDHDSKAAESFRSDAMTLNETYPGLFQAASITGKSYCVGSADQGTCDGTLHAAGCEGIVDPDVYNNLSVADQKDAYQRFSVKCAAHYRRAYGQIPRCGINYMLEDRMDNVLMYNPIQAGENC
jgi:hypothetical protein